MSKKALRKKRIKIGEHEKEIIKAVGLGLLATGILAAAVTLPGLPVALKPFLKRGQKNFKESLINLEEKDVIYLGPDKIYLTKRGKKLLEVIQISEISIKPPKRWNRLWHLVSYDIPKIKNKERDWFRKQLIDLGFVKIQESLWVYPFECVQEISVIAQTLGISPFVVVMQAKTIPNQKKIESEFGLD